MRVAKAHVVRYCSFCGKQENDPIILIVADDANICNECVDLCADIIAEHKADEHEARGEPC